MSVDAESPVLEKLDDDDRTAVAAALRRRSYPPGSAIVTQGELGTDFFLILQGTVVVMRNGEPVAELGPGEFFGELAAIDPGPGYALARNATVRARTSVDVGVVDEAGFGELLRTRPAFRAAIYATSKERERHP
jgi:cAMP-dependent protein kinase regulator